MPTTHGSRVDADLTLPASVLAALPAVTARPIREALADLDAANEALSDAYGAVATAKDAKADEAAAVTEAARSGKAAPKVNPPEWHEERVTALGAEVRRAETLARRAAKAVEDAVTAAQAEAHPLLFALLRGIHDDDVRLHAEAKANNERKHAVSSLMARLAVAAAERGETVPAHRALLAGGVQDHYTKVHAGDPSRFRRSQLPLAWSDVMTAVHGFQVDRFEPDPLKGTSYREAIWAVTEAKALQARLDADVAERVARADARRKAEASHRDASASV